MRASVLSVLLLFPAMVMAQAERYELGRRLKQFEKAWDIQTDRAARQRALEILPQVTQQFFSFRFGDAGRTLDEARWRLDAKKPSDVERWLASLYAVPEKRILAASDSTLRVTIKAFYKTTDTIPEGALVRVGFPGSPRVTVPIRKLPQPLEVPAPTHFRSDGELLENHFLQVQFMASAFQESQEIAIASILNLAEIAPKLEEIDRAMNKVETIQQATWLYLYQLFRDLQETPPETDVPIASMVKELIELAELGGQDGSLKWKTPARFVKRFPGNRWLAIPLGGRKILPFRMYDPVGSVAVGGSRAGAVAEARDQDNRPLVVALHGAGGSENLFYEGYGDGQVVKLCRERGWFLITPRSALGFAGGPPLDKLVEQLAGNFPIDRARVFVVGHSMGAAQTIACCQQHRNLVSAAAALGGGGRVSKAEAFKDLPIFIGVGTKDFALGGARALKKSLEDAGAQRCVYKEYPNLEHLVIVREALPDAFTLFDQVSEEKLKNH